MVRVVGRIPRERPQRETTPAGTTGVNLYGLAARSLDVIYRYRVRHRRGLEYVNDAASRISGYSREELYADPFRLVHPADRGILEDRTELGPLPNRFVIRWQRKDGGVLWMELQETPIYDRFGDLVAIEGIAREVAEPREPSRAAVRQLGGIRIDVGEQTVRVDGCPVALTPSELRVLLRLTERPGETFTRAQLMRSLWRSPHTGSGHACENYISRLRQKIERDPRFPERIVTVRGRGYKFIPA